MATAGVLCAIYVVLRPPSQDFASGHFRAQLFDRGVYLWNNLWFGGHPLPGYGVVPPWLGSVFGVVAVAVASVLVATWCFALLVEHWAHQRPDLGSATAAAVVFAISCSVNLWGGRLTFGPAAMFAMVCALAVQRQHWVIAVVTGALCGLSSPVGALSLGIVLAAVFITRTRSRPLVVAIAAAAVVPIGALIVLFPEGGWYPFTVGGLVLLLGAVAIVGWFGRDIALVRLGAVLYGLVALAAFVVRSPLGGNVVRLGWLMTAPLAVLVIRGQRPWVLPTALAACLVWTFSPVKAALHIGDRTADAAYYDSLAAEVHKLPQPTRIEAVPTLTFGQADELALRTSGIARGWESQLDRAMNPEFYTDRLDADVFHRWLLEHAVGYVALPLGSVQQYSQAEAALVRSEPAYLHLVWQNDDWKLYAVRDAAPLASNGSRVVDVQPESLTIDVVTPGPTVVKFRYTELYRVATGDACIEPTADGWINLVVRAPGRVTLTIDAAEVTVLHRTPSCP